MEYIREDTGALVDVLMELREQIKELKHKVSDLEIMDEVTQLYNRKSLYNFLDYEIRRAKRYSSSLSVLLLRINNYNSIRKDLGSENTNILLAELARIFKYNVRDIDIIGRYSDDIFMLILPDTSSLKAEIIAERLQRLVGLEKFSGDTKVSLSTVTKYYEGESPYRIVEIALHNL